MSHKAFLSVGRKLDVTKHLLQILIFQQRLQVPFLKKVIGFINEPELYSFHNALEF